jgi:Leucine-rich repeat (LRR) protein
LSRTRCNGGLRELGFISMCWDEKVESLELSTMKKLKVLNLFPPAACAGMKRLCDIKELPAELGAMGDLESLDLSNNKNLHIFPPAACAGMKKLNLSGCGIQELPAELGAMSELESLNLSVNRSLHRF